MGVELRPYQRRALDTVFERMRTSASVLVVAATGAGKTILFSSLVRTCRERYPAMRIGILAHREQLVRQARDKLLKVWPEAEPEVGIVCASVSSKAEMDRPVVIGSPQSLMSRIGDMPPLHLLVVDECHRIPPKSEESQYGSLISTLRGYYPGMRLIGVTATPHRLGHGYIYGQEDDWFDGIAASVGIRDLQEDGFLCGLKAMKAADCPDLSGVSVRRGDYIAGELGNIMSSPVILGTAVHAVEDYASDRKHIVVFGVTCEHADLLAERFRVSGFTVSTIHSKMSREERSQALDDFDSGKSRVICNVGVLTEGWDSPHADCIVMCRPTKSPALWTQMVGRGLRLSTGKKDCMLLDLSGNWDRLGDPADPKVSRKVTGEKSEEEDVALEGEAVHPCPQCGAEINKTAIACPWCGCEVKAVLEERQRMVEAEQARAFGTQKAAVSRSFTLDAYTSRKGNRMARLRFRATLDGAAFDQPVSVYMDVEGNASPRGRANAQFQWMALTGSMEAPSTVDEMVERAGEIVMPEACILRQSGRYLNVERWVNG